MGVGETATQGDVKNAFDLGKLIAREGWVLLTGGVKAGIMDAASRGAKEAGGLTVGIIPRTESKISDFVDIPVVTNMGAGRNYINILSSDAVVICGAISPGTLSEIAFALQLKKPIVFLGTDQDAVMILKKIGGENISRVEIPEDVVLTLRSLICRDS